MAKIYTRFQQKSDTYTNWNKVPASSFIPLKGELIIYLPDGTNSKTSIKIGNGTDYIENLTFIDTDPNAVTSVNGQTGAVIIDIPEDTNTTYTLTKSGSTIILNGSDGSSTNVQIIDYGMTLPSTGENGQIFLLKA